MGNTRVHPLSIFFSFSGVYTFGLFTVDIFVNAGQVVTGNLAPYFLTICKPNYTALGCQQALRYISHQEACTGNQDDILRARKTFPSKEAALSVYAALYLAVSHAALLLHIYSGLEWRNSYSRWFVENQNIMGSSFLPYLWTTHIYCTCRYKATRR